MYSSVHHPHTKISRSPKGGFGLFATGAIARGEVIVITGGKLQPFASLLTSELPEHPIQVETHVVLAPMDPAKLDGIFITNHSCDPNAGISGQLSLIAIRPISAGEEICFDYVMTDSDPDGKQTFAMDCLCRAEACRGRITDMDWRNEHLQRRYKGFFSSYLQRRIAGASA